MIAGAGNSARCRLGDKVVADDHLSVDVRQEYICICIVGFRAGDDGIWIREHESIRMGVRADTANGKPPQISQASASCRSGTYPTEIFGRARAAGAGTDDPDRLA